MLARPSSESNQPWLAKMAEGSRDDRNCPLGVSEKVGSIQDSLTFDLPDFAVRNEDRPGSFPSV